jgi:tetratricopeptide (TPR) repeat protein
VPDDRQPTADSRRPTAESRKPKAESREPTAASREPKAEGREPKAESLLAVGVLVYALLAACHTLKNFDLGWQLAAGRYIVETGRIPGHDIFSYTAAGKEWIYPVGAQIFFYLLYRLGGYAALTVLGMAMCVSTAALLLFGRQSTADSRQPDVFRLFLVALAVPYLADRTGPRAEMFTTLLLPAVLLIVWRYRRGVGNGLYLLPFLFAIWANLHQGFLFGLAILALATAVELGRRIFVRSRQPSAISHLHPLLAVSALSAAAVLLNPWGWRLYSSLWRVQQDQAFQRGLITEATGVPWGLWRLKDVIRFDDPNTGFWTLLPLALLGAVLAVRRREVFAAVVLGGSCWLGLRFLRGQVFVLLASAILLPGLAAGGFPAAVGCRPALRAFGSWLRAALLRQRSDRRPPAASRKPKAEIPQGGTKADGRWPIAHALAALLALMLVVRSADLISDRYYFKHGEITSFGVGLSWWFPERALNFIQRERLPGRLYHDYNLGGWVMWRLWPGYQVYIDGRAQPYTPQILIEDNALAGWKPGSPEWRAFLDRWGINTVLLSLARHQGTRLTPAEFCAAPDFRLVYLDEVSGIWMRATPQNQPWIGRLAVPCPPPPIPVAGSSPSERYIFLANAGELYHAFGRNDDALEAYQQATQIFSGDPTLHYAIARLWISLGRPADARREYESSLDLGESSAAWQALGWLDAQQGRHQEAVEAFARAAARASLPQECYRLLGEAYLRINQPARALQAFQKARETNRFSGQTAWLAARWLAQVEDGERRARIMLGR